MKFVVKKQYLIRKANIHFTFSQFDLNWNFCFSICFNLDRYDRNLIRRITQPLVTGWKLGFPRDGTSRDNPGRDVPLSLCPGTKKFPCPAVPLSRDKKSFLVPLSLCPGTRATAKIPGQALLSRDVPRDKNITVFRKKFKKKIKKKFLFFFLKLF